MSKCDSYCLRFVRGWIRYRFWRRLLCVLDFSWFCIFLLLLWLTTTTSFFHILLHSFFTAILSLFFANKASRNVKPIVIAVYWQGYIWMEFYIQYSLCPRVEQGDAMFFRLYSTTRTCRSDAIYKSLPVKPVTDKTLLHKHRDCSLKMSPESLYFWEI